MSDKLLCDDCGKTISDKFFGTVDEAVRCERCAFEKYKKDHPITYKLFLCDKGIIDFDAKA